MKISVIIPVHNGEKFIWEFIECLSKQTMKEYEAIFIDDCSSDHTEDLLRKAAILDKRWHYYRNDRQQGAAYSRNRGIELSSAPYIQCLDIDDRFEDDLLEQLNDAAYINDADMVMLNRGDFYGFDLNTIKRSRHIFEDEKELLIKSPFSVENQPIDFLLRCENGTCDRMIRKSMLDKYQIRFQNLKSSNDVFYTVFSTFAAEKIVHTQSMDNLYHRRVHTEPGRISNQRDPICAFQALQKIYHHLKRYNLWNSYCIYFWILALDSLEKQMFCCKDGKRQEEVYKYIQEKGLFELGIEKDKNYTLLPKEIKLQYKKFLTMPYEEKCFNQSMILEALGTAYSTKFGKLKKQLTGKIVGFWGMGRVTGPFIDAYRRMGGSIEVIIDNNQQKQGAFFKGIQVAAFEKVVNKIDVIIISNRHYFEAIYNQIMQKTKEIEVLSLEEILYREK